MSTSAFKIRRRARKSSQRRRYFAKFNNLLREGTIGISAVVLGGVIIYAVLTYWVKNHPVTAPPKSEAQLLDPHDLYQPTGQ